MLELGAHCQIKVNLAVGSRNHPTATARGYIGIAFGTGAVTALDQITLRSGRKRPSGRRCRCFKRCDGVRQLVDLVHHTMFLDLEPIWGRSSLPMAGDLKRISNVSRLSSSSSNSANRCTYRQSICYLSKVAGSRLSLGKRFLVVSLAVRRLTEFGRFSSLLVFCFGSRLSRQAGGCYLRGKVN